jgi:spermidine/putrescine transport system ATP-binding protein
LKALPRDNNAGLSGSGVSSISIVDVTKVFGQGAGAFKALEAVSVEIAKNEFFTLLGPSGCGKTTLLRLIAGFEQPTSGTILLDGREISADPPYRRPINTVFQNYALFPHMTVAQNIAFGLEMLGRPKGEIGRTTEEMLALVKMTPMANRRITQISGGQQQRVALARALAPRPEVLLLDEPLSALDLQLRKDMQIELKRLQQETGITFVFVTHDQQEALTMSDRIAVMNAGEILQVGSPHDIYERPQRRFVASFIGEINLLVATAGSGDSYAVEQCGTLQATGRETVATSAKVVLAVRPERIALGKPGDGGLPGTITNIVFHGTDTIYHFSLPDGTAMRARSQNSSPEALPIGIGDEIGWTADPRSVSVLEDT